MPLVIWRVTYINCLKALLDYYKQERPSSDFVQLNDFELFFENILDRTQKHMCMSTRDDLRDLFISRYNLDSNNNSENSSLDNFSNLFL